MSLNHIIQSSVPDDEALNAKFKDLEILGNLEVAGDISGGFPGIGFYKQYYQQTGQTVILASAGVAETMYNATGGYGSLTIPANTLKAGSIVKAEFKGTMFNEQPGTAVNFKIKFTLGAYDMINVFTIPFNQVTGDQDWNCNITLHVKPGTISTTYLNFDSPNGSALISLKSDTATLNPYFFDVATPLAVNALLDIEGYTGTDVNITTTYATLDIL